MPTSQVTLGRITAGLYFRNTVLRARSLFVLALLLVDLGLVVLYVSEKGTGSGFGALTNSVVLGFILPFVALLYGTAVVRDEADSGTITYLLTRPISRKTLYLARLAGAWLVVFGTCITVGISNAAIMGGTSAIPRTALTMALGATCYTTLFGALGALLKRPFIAGILFLLFVDLPLSEIPMAARFVTIQANLKNTAGLVKIPEPLLALLGDPPSMLSSTLVLLGLSTAGILLGTSAFTRREYIAEPAKV